MLPPPEFPMKMKSLSVLRLKKRSPSLKLKGSQQNLQPFLIFLAMNTTEAMNLQYFAIKNPGTQDEQVHFWLLLAQRNAWWCVTCFFKMPGVSFGRCCPSCVESPLFPFFPAEGLVPSCQKKMKELDIKSEASKKMGSPSSAHNDFCCLHFDSDVEKFWVDRSWFFCLRVKT